MTTGDTRQRLQRLSALTTALLAWAALTHSALADGVVVDKVYHPYVDALEYELEYRSVFQDAQPVPGNIAHWHQVSLGHSLGDDLFLELYMIGAKQRGKSFDTKAWEAELKWQLTEQGEYWADFGMFMEYEEDLSIASHEVAVGFLAEKEFGRWSAAANFFVVNEWGKEVVDELESVLSTQIRYRHSETFEPGFELYAGQDNRSIGPMLQGTFRTGDRKSLHWEVGALFGTTKASPNTSWRLLLEYEF